ncbi:DHA2 family efflux MFS transporter permease subunit [Paenibacillus albiflavus]|uniref:DHA2 family efflux MFS transporter permease subunit n=1 Tax=Paenibacillus albiflavus TaxID=2545760 RepID=A0A4R4EL60_9BACL|nr:MDR family MFS transporter [Paenibacillus albiflavus]TCZ80070.1 DHA2 family efflux MFS transporter permease subunit [Paenibacillus albiflavus]
MDKGKSKLGFVITALLLGILMSAMDNTIVAAAMGTIVSELGGLDKFVWVTSAYLIASAAGMPIFGKLSDMYGRKRFFIFGVIVFLIGSILCGTAETIVQLSIYRAIQGIGGGALMPIAFTIVFDIFPPEKRGKVAGLFGAVFGTSNLFGPLLGAYITEYYHWSGIFYVNVPIGIVVLVLISLYYHESMEHSKQRIDWWGAGTLVTAVVSLMFALEFGGTTFAWDSWVIIGLFVLFVVCTTLFILIERKVAEPIISFEMFARRLFASSTLAGLCYGAAFITAAVYIPIYVQGVLGGSATNSGLILLPMTLASVVASQTGGFLTTKLSFRNIMIISAIIFISGISLLSMITPETSRTTLTMYMLITGFGVGFSFSVLSMSAIHNMEMRQRGSANSTMSFVRTIGMTLGITIFGILQRNSFSGKMTDAFAGSGASFAGDSGNAREILSQANRAKMPPEILTKIINALSSSIAQTFFWAIVPAVLAFIFVLMMGNERVKAPLKVKKPSVQE